jgi:RPA family protein
MDDVNNICVSGVITWLKLHAEQERVTFSLRNTQGSFYVEAALGIAASLQRGERVMVVGLIYSHFRQGVERTRIQAETITRIG